MKVDKNELEKALKMATSEHWEDGLPTVPAKLRLAVSSLLSQSHRELTRDIEIFFSLINNPRNTGIRRILSHKKITTEALAFAIRDALS